MSAGLMSMSMEAQKLPLEGIPGTNMERTFIAIKPDGTVSLVANKQ
jgi:hypothetical protein